MSFPEEQLAAAAENLGLSLNLRPYREGGVALTIDPEEAETLRRHLRRLESVVTTNSDIAKQKWVCRELEEEISFRLLRLLATTPPDTTPIADGFRVLAARRARDFIDSHASESPTIVAVCRDACVSWRALDYAFKEVFGISPKQYLQAARLDGVRKNLNRMGPSAKIGDIANAWGFWHMGQFAKDYRRQFGELPSETVRRVVNS